MTGGFFHVLKPRNSTAAPGQISAPLDLDRVGRADGGTILNVSFFEAIALDRPHPVPVQRRDLSGVWR